MPQFLQSSKKLYTVPPLVCHSPLGSGDVNLAPGRVWNVLCPRSTMASVGGTSSPMVRDAKSGCRWDVGDFTVVWEQGFTELAWKELRAGQDPWGGERGTS